jgi:voltage-gated potassium channel
MTNSLCRRLDRDAPLPMFVASVAMLVLLAGEIHFSRGKMFSPLLWACHTGLAVLWPVFLLEALVHVFARSPRWKQQLAYCLCPPLRLGARDACTGQRVWLPGWGWSVVNRDLQEHMEQKLNVPMILIALCVIPLLALDYYQPEHHPLVHQVRDSIATATATNPTQTSAPVQSSQEADTIPAALAWARWPAVRFATRVGEALIWAAFALEFTVMISIVDRKFRYCRQHWIDLLVIILPLIGFLRSLRLARLARLHQVGKFTRLYRLRGSVVRAQRGMVVASVVERKLVRNPRKQLAQLKDALVEKERETETLRKRIRELEQEIERQDAGRRVA